MARAFALLVLTALALGVPQAQARPLTLDEKLSDLNQLVSLIKSGYGPLRYKAERNALSVDRLRDRYAAKVAATQNNGEFYYLIVQFVAEFQDSHFGASLPTTHQADLRFTTDLVQGKVLIDSIDRSQLPEAKFPFAKGDEITAIDGRDVQSLLDELQLNMVAGYKQTARRRAAFALTVRAGSILPVPSGEAKISVRHGTSAAIDEVRIPWVVTGQPVDESDKALELPARRDFDSLSISYDSEAERAFRCSGITRVEIPRDATILVTDPFVAYYHPTPKGNVGYLRIPHYSWGKDEALRFAQYEYAIDQLERNTVGLVIDQDHNCGGSIEFLHRMVSLFVDRPFRPLQFTLLANKEELLQFKQWMDETDMHTLEYAGLQKVYGLIKKNWEEGAFMTPSTSIVGNTEVAPNPVHYTRPIVMLIDEMSGSGGDAFPAVMQGIGRAKLLGTRTMGAGGHVVEQPRLFYSQIGIRMTKSLFYRPDGVAVENNGAVPDYPYEPTRDDFTYGYRDYRAFYLSKLLEAL